MLTRITPEDYVRKELSGVESPNPNSQVQYPQNQMRYVYVPTYQNQQGQGKIPLWVPIIIGICIIGSFAVALRAISKVK